MQWSQAVPEYIGSRIAVDLGMKAIAVANKFVLSALLGLTTAACSSEFVETANSLEGIYRVDSHNYNEAMCAPGGESLITEESEGYVVAFTEEVFGTDLLIVDSCASPENCRDKYPEWKTGGYFKDFGFTVSKVEGNRLTGLGSSTGFGVEGQCEGGEKRETSMAFDETSISIELSETDSDTYPQDDGLCWTDQALKAAKGNSCSRMETMTATFVESL